MDGGLLSFQARMTKPNPDFYQLFLKQFGLTPEECVFIDDTPENVAEAQRQGFQTILFTSREETEEKLAALL